MSSPALPQAQNAIAVVVVSYNTREHLRACLASAMAESPAQLVVVDNASDDGSVEMVQSDFPGVLLWANVQNQGYGAAANQGIHCVQTDYVVVLNADTLLRSGALAALAGYLDQHPDVAVVGPRLTGPDGVPYPSCYPFPTPLGVLFEYTALGRLARLVGYIPWLRRHSLRHWPHDCPRQVPWVQGAVLAMRREMFQAVGGFDESFFMYLEETDLCYRLQARGWKTHFVPSATVAHIGGASTQQYRARMFVELAASTVRFFQHHNPRQLTELIAVLKATMMTRIALDTARLALTRDPLVRTHIAEGIAAWRQVLGTSWQGARVHG